MKSTGLVELVLLPDRQRFAHRCVPAGACAAHYGEIMVGLVAATGLNGESKTLGCRLCSFL